MVHVGIHSLGTYQKSLVAKIKKKYALPSVTWLTLGKESSLPSANHRPSVKVNGR
jgi:hypothetical protein